MVKINNKLYLVSLQSINNLCCMEVNNNNTNNNNNLDNIRSKYILRQIFSNMDLGKKLKIVNYNKNFQNNLDLTLNDYKYYSLPIEIEIEIIKLTKKKAKKFFFYFFENIKKFFDIKYKYKNSDEYKILSKIEELFGDIEKIILTNRKKIENLYKFFYGCSFITSIKFIKYIETRITNTSCMFYNCYSLEKLDLSNFYTKKVTDMSHMFSGCKKLK